MNVIITIDPTPRLNKIQHCAMRCSVCLTRALVDKNRVEIHQIILAYCKDLGLGLGGALSWLLLFFSFTSSSSSGGSSLIIDSSITRWASTDALLGGRLPLGLVALSLFKCVKPLSNKCCPGFNPKSAEKVMLLFILIASRNSYNKASK